MNRRVVAVLAVVGVTGTLLAGCFFREAICASGEYPAAAVRSTTGRTCVPDGQEPPTGYVRFPAGKAPEHVGDDWDDYWHAHMVDENGQEIG